MASGEGGKMIGELAFVIAALGMVAILMIAISDVKLNLCFFWSSIMNYLGIIADMFGKQATSCPSFFGGA